MRGFALFRYFALIALPGTILAQDLEISWRDLLPNFLEDQKSIWTFPARLDQPHDFVPTIAVAGVATGLLLGADPPVAHYSRNTGSFGDFNNIFNSHNTSIGPALAPAGLLVIGLIKKDKKMRDTAYIGAETPDRDVAGQQRTLRQASHLDGRHKPNERRNLIGR